VVRGVVMVGSFGDDFLWCQDFCTDFCVVTCTRFGMSAKVAVCVELVFANALVNAIQCQWYCVSTQWGFGRLGQLAAAQCWTCHG